MKIAIVDRKSKQAVASYNSDQLEQRTGRFGGPWDDPSLFEHVKIPMILQDEELSNLEAYNGEEQVGTQMVQVGESPAYDEQKKPIKNSLGAQVMIPKYEEQPVMEPRRLMRRKS